MLRHIEEDGQIRSEKCGPTNTKIIKPVLNNVANRAKFISKFEIKGFQFTEIFFLIFSYFGQNWTE